MRTLATIVYRALYAVGWVMGHGEELTGRALRLLMLVCVLCGGCWMQTDAVHFEVTVQADNARVDVED